LSCAVEKKPLYFLTMFRLTQAQVLFSLASLLLAGLLLRP
jgi:hypothetical protein